MSNNLEIATRLILEANSYIASARTAQKANKDFKESVDGVGEAGKRSKVGLGESESASKSLGTTNKGLKSEVDKSTAAVKNQGTAISSSAEEAKRSISKYVSVSAAIAGLTATITTAIAGYVGFQYSMAEVNTLFGDTQNISAYKDSVRELSVEFGSNKIEQAGAIYQVVSAGAENAAEATNILSAANKLAVGGVTDVKTAADGLTSVMNAYGLESTEANRISDVMFSTMKSGKTTISELSGSLGQVVPLAASLDIEFEELSAVLATLTTNGVGTSEAVTQVKAALSNVLKPTSEASKLADELGIDFSVSGLKAKGFAGFIDEVATATGGSSEKLSTLFGSVEAVQAVMPLAGAQADKFAEILDRNTHSAGATDEAFKLMTETLSFKWDVVRQEFANTALTLGETLEPAVLSSIEGLSVMIDIFPDVAKDAGVAFAAFAAYKTLPAVFTAVAAQVTFAANAVQLAGVRGAASAASLSVLSGGLKLIGGPAGLAAIAAFGIYKLATAETSAERQANAMSAALQNLGMQGLDPTSAKTEELKQEMIELAVASQRATLVEYKTSLLDMQSRTDEAKARIVELRAIIERPHISDSALAFYTQEMQVLEGVVDSGELAQKRLNVQIKQGQQTLLDYVDEVEVSATKTNDLRGKTEELSDGMIDLGDAAGDKGAASDIDDQADAIYQLELQATQFFNKIPEKWSDFEENIENANDRIEAVGETLETSYDAIDAYADEHKHAAQEVNQYWETAQEGIHSATAEFFREGLDGWDSFTDSIEDMFKDMLAEMGAAWLVSGAAQWFGSALGGDYTDFSGFNINAFTGGGSIGGGSNSTASSDLTEAVIGEQNASYLGVASSGYNTIDAASNGDWVEALASGYSTYQSGVTAGLWGGTASTTTSLGTGTALVEGYTGSAVAIESGATTVASGSGATGGSAIGTGLVYAAGIGLAYEWLDDIFGGRNPHELAGDQYASVVRQENDVQRLSDNVSHIGNYNDETSFFNLDTNASVESIAVLLRDVIGYDEAISANVSARDFSTGRRDDGSEAYQEYLSQGLAGEALRVLGDEIDVTHIEIAIASIETALTGLEATALQSMGEMTTQMDANFSLFEASGLSAAESVLLAHQATFGTSIEESQRWLDESGVSAERWAEIFNLSSGEVLLGVSEIGQIAGTVFEDLGVSAERSAAIYKTSFVDASAKVFDAADGVSEGVSETWQSAMLDMEGWTSESTAAMSKYMAKFGADASSVVSGVAGKLYSLNDVQIGVSGEAGSQSVTVDVPSYSVGTPELQSDGLIYAHKGEIIMDPTSSEILRKYGINVNATGGNSNSSQVADQVVVALIAKLDKQISAMDLMLPHLRQQSAAKVPS